VESHLFNALTKLRLIESREVSLGTSPPFLTPAGVWLQSLWKDRQRSQRTWTSDCSSTAFSHPSQCFGD
jgi:hypothetical protein